MTTPASAAVAFTVSLIMAPLVLWSLKRGRIMDEPSARSSHQKPVPRGGGLAPALGCLVGVALLSAQLRGKTWIGIVVVASGMGLLGLVDDLRRPGPLPRLLGQVAVAVLGLAWLARDVKGPPGWQVVFCAGVVLWLVGYVNAFNFMDGINGISSVQVICAGIAWWVLGQTQHVPVLAAAGLIAAAAAIAFAPFNAPHATMFLGDVGSYFLGGWLASVAVIGVRGGLPPEAVLAPLAVYGADTFVTLARRVARGEQWYRPHRQHTYQRLVQLGWSHATTSLIVGAAMVVTTGFGALSLTGSPGWRALGDAFALLTIATYLALPDLRARRAGCDPAPVPS